MSKTISVLGSTGSIGRQTLDVADRLGCRVAALTAHDNVDLLEAQVRRYKPDLAVLYSPAAAETLRVRLRDTGTRVASGMEGLVAAAEAECADTVVTAVVGTVGLRPTLAAIGMGKRIALANKETLVCAGSLVMAAAKRYGAEILPVDSEHSAIFQCLQGNRREDLDQILLTGSGGPFRTLPASQLPYVTRADALRHPNWSMGPKITVDSATMMNKGLEFIEAMHLFGVAPEQIRVVVHPQSVVHSMVQFRDHSVIAQLGVPDMRIPIQLALTYPARADAPAPALDLTALAALTFEEPDPEKFPLLALALRLAGRQDTSCAVMNAANEEAVRLFLEEKIPFTGIYELVERAVETIDCVSAPALEDILAADAAARAFILAERKGT